MLLYKIYVIYILSSAVQIFLAFCIMKKMFSMIFTLCNTNGIIYIFKQYMFHIFYTRNVSCILQVCTTKLTFPRLPGGPPGTS